MKQKELLALVILALVLSGASLYFSFIAYQKINELTEPRPAQPEQAVATVDDDPQYGNANAPITIIEFSDFQCPFCKRWHDETWPLIKEQYVKAGKVKLVYRDFPLTNIHQHALKAAEAAECAGEQDKFWEYHNLLFANQQALDVPSLKRYAKQLKLNVNRFDECLDSGEKFKEVEQDFKDGAAAGVEGTPGFFVNAIAVSGAQPFSVFEPILEEALSQ